MSYEFITYKGKKYPVKLGYHALKCLQKEHGATMETIQGDMSLYEPLLFYSLESGHKLAKKEMPFKMEDMEEILEDCMYQFILLIPKFFPSDLEKMMEVGGTAQQ